MAVFLVRKRTVEPKIDVADDIRAFKYGSFNNGVLKDYLQECEYEIKSNTFFIKSGEIFIDAEQLDIDANGKEIEIVDFSGVNYYSVYAEIDLTDYNNQTGDIKATYSSITYPSIDKGDDLTLINNGIARLELYRFEVNSGRISNVQKMFDMVEKNAEIKMNNDGLLTMGDIIIPQRIKIGEAINDSFTATKLVVILSKNVPLKTGDLIEIEIEPQISSSPNGIQNSSFSNYTSTQIPKRIFKKYIIDEEDVYSLKDNIYSSMETITKYGNTIGMIIYNLSMICYSDSVVANSTTFNKISFAISSYLIAEKMQADGTTETVIDLISVSNPPKSVKIYKIVE